jgi:hypothetical protein
MNARKAARLASALVWGLLGMVFGLGLVLAGVHALSTPGGAITLVVGLIIMGAAWCLHRLTCMGTDRIFRRHA